MRLPIAIYAFFAFVLTPFVVTALYRVTPVNARFWEYLPFGLVALASGALWIRRSRWRPVAVAVWAALALYFVFLAWLFTGLSEFD